MKIIPVDLFPQTRGFELVIFFERVGWGDILNTEIAKRIRWRQRDNRERRTLIAIIYYCRDVETENLDDMVSLADRLKNERETAVEKTE